MNPVEQLRDIHGLEPVSWWPLAPGWWIIVGVILLFLVFGISFLIYRHFTKKEQSPDWRQVALAEWTTLTTEPFTPKERLTHLNILLRRVAMQRYGRQTCAGLTGEPWLIWLTEHDPHGFNWQQHGQPLLQLPYMPPDTTLTEEQLLTLYQAVRAWIAD